MRKIHYSISNANCSVREAQKRWEEYLDKIVFGSQFETRPELMFEGAAYRYDGRGFFYNIIERNYLGNATSLTTKIKSRAGIGATESRLYTLMLVDQDGHRYVQNGKQFDLNQGDILLLNQQDQHTYMSSHRSIRIKSLTVSEHALREWLPDNLFESTRIIETNDGWGQSLRTAFDIISPRTLDNLGNNGGRYAESLCCLLSLSIDDPADKVSSYRLSLLNRFRNAIRSSFSNPDFCAVTLAQESGVSRRILHATFKAAGSFFHEELMAMRIAYAKTLLEHQSPELLLVEVALRSGFKNASYFSSAFKRHVGVSPQIYKRDRRC